MATALRKAQELESAGRVPDKAGPDEMIDPLHPMHQHLLARFSAPTSATPAMSRPPLMAPAFYAGIAAWGALWLVVNSAINWL